MSEDCSDSDCFIVGDTQAIRVARKSHTCCGCKRTIKPGERYSYTALVLSSGYGLEQYKRCGACEVTFQHLSDLCEQDRKVNCESMLYPRHDLGCGLKYEKEWGALPEHIAALPFLSNAEASALLAPVKR